MRWHIMTHVLLTLLAVGFAENQKPQEPQSPIDLQSADAITFPELLPAKGHFLLVPLRIVDGDTVETGIVVKLPGRGRLKGIQAPERKTEAGPKSTKHLEAILPLHQATEGRLFGPEKFGGYEVDFKCPSGCWATKNQVDTGHAIWWDGKGKRPD